MNKDNVEQYEWQNNKPDCQPENKVLPSNKSMPRTIVECDNIRMDKTVYCNACVDILSCNWPDKKDIEQELEHQKQEIAKLKRELDGDWEYLEQRAKVIVERDKEIAKLKREIQSYWDTTLIFRRVSAIYYNSPNIKEEPAASAVQLLIKQGEQAIENLRIRRTEDYIKHLQSQLAELKTENEKLKKWKQRIRN